MFSEESLRPTVMFADTKFIWMCGKDLEVWQTSEPPFFPLKERPAHVGNVKTWVSWFGLFCWAEGRQWELCLPHLFRKGSEETTPCPFTQARKRCSGCHYHLLQLTSHASASWTWVWVTITLRPYQNQYWVSPRIYFPQVTVGPKNPPVLVFPVVTALLACRITTCTLACILNQI